MAQRHGPFVGRIPELEQLQQAVDRALSGNGGMVALAGEPGIGKTRAAQELEQYATDHGALVYWGHCYEDAGSPPYWPWLQALGACVRARDADALRKEEGDRAAEIAELIPDLRDKLPNLPSASELAPIDARFRLFDSVAMLLRAASSSTPLVLVLEDLHWADEPSLQLLLFVARQLADTHALIVMTYRDMALGRRHPLAETLGELTRDRLFNRLVLRGLSESDVSLYIESVAKELSTAPVANDVFARTEGNPFFVSEVVRLLAAEGGMGAPGGSLRIPEGVREVVGLRLNKLSEACNDALTPAAIVGKEFALAQLAPLLDIPGAELIGVLKEATTAQLIHETGPATYSFTHALVQQTLAEELSPTERLQLHSQVAESLEFLYADRAGAHAAELAFHFEQAQLVTGPDKVVEYSLLAGEQALATYAYEAAREHFDKVLSIKEGLTEDGDSAQARFGLAKVQGASTQLREAWSNATRAFDHFVEAGTTELAVAVASYPLFYTPGVPNIARLTTRALDMVPPDSIDAGWLLTRYGMLHNLSTGDYQGSSEALAKALVIARKEGDQRLEIQALANAADVSYYHYQNDDVLEKGRQVVSLAQSIDDPFAQVWPRWLVLFTLMNSGIVEDIDTMAQELLAQAERTRNQGFLANALLLNALIPQLRGQFQKAREVNERGRRTLPGYYGFAYWRVLLEYETGNVDAGEASAKVVRAIANELPPGPSGEYASVARMDPLVARINGSAGSFDAAERAGQAVVSSPNAPPLIAAMARTGLAMIAIHRGDVGAAQEQYEQLARFQGQMIVGMMSGDNLLGLLARTIGTIDQAISHFQDAIEFNKTAGYLPNLVWASHDYAETLLLRANPGDAEQATTLIDQGLEITHELGMLPLARHLTGLRERVAAAPAKTPRYPDGLTEREVEVIGLIAAGRTNPEIADQLIVSVRTVSTHVTNILTKIGAANRTEAATYATRHDLA